MKISLLLQREPFAAIVQKTLANYLSRIRGVSASATWTKVPWYRRGASLMPGEWLCHPQLNAIFSERVLPSALAPLEKEFSQSVAPLRRPFQAIYVKAALTPRLARWFASVRLRFEPAFPDECDQVIVPGNQKIRILNHRAQTSTCVLKDGFSQTSLQREVEARRRAEAIGIPVPKIHAFDPEGGWLREDYLCATPLNRLARAQDRQLARSQALEYLDSFLAHTAHEVPLEKYLGQLEAELDQLLRILDPRDPRLTQDLRQAVKLMGLAIRNQAAATNNPRISLAFGHGDFQPANILVNDSGVWIIDWENALTRQKSYDYWVLFAEARFPRGLTERMTQLCTSESPRVALDEALIASFSHSDRLVSALFFYLEELSWRLHEENHPLFYRAAPGLYAFAHEFLQWSELFR